MKTILSALKKSALIAFCGFSLLTTNSFAAGNTGGDVPTSTSGLVSNSKAILTESSSAKNATGSCDSTCDAMGVSNAPAVNAAAAFMTQVVACGSGYTGSKTQTRNQNPDGSFTPWVDADTSLCVCTPTYTDTTQSCAAPLGGTYVQRTPWVCNANVGSNGAPSTISNSCFTPCALPSPSSQSQTLSCPSGYTGTYSQQRNASCPGGVGSNSTAAWSAWTTTSNSCVPAGPPPVTLGNNASYMYFAALPPMDGGNGGSYMSSRVLFANNYTVGTNSYDGAMISIASGIGAPYTTPPVNGSCSATYVSGGSYPIGSTFKTETFYYEGAPYDMATYRLNYNYASSAYYCSCSGDLGSQAMYTSTYGQCVN